MPPAARKWERPVASESAEPNRSGSSKAPFEDAWRFIIRVGTAAQRYGSTATRLESFLSLLSSRFGYPGVFRSTPSGILFAMRERPESPQRIELVATAEPGVDLDKLARLGDTLSALMADTLTLADAEKQLDVIDRTLPPWGRPANLLGYAFVGLGLAPLLGGGWSDTFVATLLSMLVYGLVLLSGRLGATAMEWMPLTTAFFAGVFAATLKGWVPDLNLVLVVLSAVAVILPGYTISLGAGELVGRHVVSGMSNLARGLVCLVKQIAGGWLGVATGSMVIAGTATGATEPVDGVWVQLFFALLLVGLCVVFRTSRRDMPSALAVSGLAYLGILGGSAVLDADLGNLVGTILAVVSANLWARRTRRPTSIVLVPAIVMLVSGSIGFRGLASLAGGELVLGIEQFLRMFVVAFTVLAGIMIGNTLIRSEPTL